MDEAAFRDIYERTAPRLRAWLYLALGDSSLADDLLQEAFLRLLRADPGEPNIHQVRSYLYKTARSLVVDHGRRATRERDTVERRDEAASRAPRHDLTLDMERLFALLSPRQQTLLWLAYVEGFSHREIAASMGIKPGSVRVILYRARKAFAGVLQEHGWSPGEVR